jgi:hypothetical protein
MSEAFLSAVMEVKKTGDANDALVRILGGALQSCECRLSVALT